MFSAGLKTFARPSTSPAENMPARGLKGFRALGALLLGGCAFLAPTQWTPAPPNVLDVQLALADIDMSTPYRPPDADEPPSPANTMILLTVGFVFAAFILPLLLAGIQSKNKDIAGADERGTPRK
mmetsp:Transcript_91518/g.218171  ORF Transcript_91518/g.218171 Transcript_91518/m.218171 type:complete len:125 (-) Transcript_91518:79-453(-)